MHTAAISANASEFRFFTNGASFASGAGNYQMATGTSKTVIGAANNVGATIIAAFNGEIAFAFAASQHLSAANVAALNDLYKSTLGTGFVASLTMSYETTSRTIALRPRSRGHTFPCAARPIRRSTARRRGEHNNHRRSLG
jgi:uncharacterized protein YukE